MRHRDGLHVSSAELAIGLMTGVIGYAMSNAVERLIENRATAPFAPITAPMSIEQHNQEIELLKLKRR